MNDDLSQDETILLRFITETGTFESRLAERSDGDHEFLQRGVPSGLQMLEDVVIRTLHRLERRGFLTHRSTVRPDDSSEYINTWRLTGNGRR